MIQGTEFLITIVAFILSVSIHEFSHAFVAYLLGDDTAKQQGRLTLNPLSHIDPLGLLFLILFRFGWAKPVPFDARNFSYPRLFSVFVGLAGPLSNFLLAVFSIALLKHWPWASTSVSAATYLIQGMRTFIYINVMLGLFNLIPFPPLDGSHIIYALIPKSWYPLYYKIQKFSILILVLILAIPQVNKAFLNLIVQTTQMLYRLVL